MKTIELCRLERFAAEELRRTLTERGHLAGHDAVIIAHDAGTETEITLMRDGRVVVDLLSAD